MRLLLVEDDQMLGAALVSALTRDAYTVDWLRDGVSAQTALQQSDAFDVVILDLGLPRRDGLAVLAATRRAGNAVPVLVLTARDTVQDRVRGLDAGADDYLLKPFDIHELQARIRALLRRHHGRAAPELVLGRIVLRPESQEVLCDGRLVSLARREYMLLKELLEHAGQVLTRERLEQSLYGWQDDVESNALEVHIHHLRRKLYGELIRTVRGVGYVIEKAGPA